MSSLEDRLPVGKLQHHCFHTLSLYLGLFYSCPDSHNKRPLVGRLALLVSFYLIFLSP